MAASGEWWASGFPVADAASVRADAGSIRHVPPTSGMHPTLIVDPPVGAMSAQSPAGGR